MNRKEIVNSQDYKATEAAIEWWYSLSDEQRRATDIDAQPDIIDAYSDGVIYGWNNPNWIKVDENNLPPKLKGKQYTDYYFVYGSRGVQKMRYNYDRRDWQDERGMMFIAIQGITHYMPIVPPRKEE